MPRTSIWAPVVHKTTMEQIIVPNLLLKPMLPAKLQIHATLLTTTMPGYNPYLHRQHHCTVTCNLEFAICVACLKLFLIGAKGDGLMSLSRSVLMEESEIATVADVLTNPPGKCLWLAISVRQTSKLWRIEFCDGPNALFNKRPVCGVPRELTEPHWVWGQTRCVLRKTRWVRFVTPIIGWEELTEFSPRNSVRAKKLTEFDVWNREPYLRDRFLSSASTGKNC